MQTLIANKTRAALDYLIKAKLAGFVQHYKGANDEGWVADWPARAKRWTRDDWHGDTAADISQMEAERAASASPAPATKSGVTKSTRKKNTSASASTPARKDATAARSRNTSATTRQKSLPTMSGAVQSVEGDLDDSGMQRANSGAVAARDVDMQNDIDDSAVNSKTHPSHSQPATRNALARSRRSSRATSSPPRLSVSWDDGTAVDIPTPAPRTRKSSRKCIQQSLALEGQKSS